MTRSVLRGRIFRKSSLCHGNTPTASVASMVTLCHRLLVVDFDFAALAERVLTDFQMTAGPGEEINGIDAAI
jgi:hypothetical protein